MISTRCLAVAHRERDEYLGMVQRVQADFENYKKRMLRQQTELLERAAESLVIKLLPVLDALNLARAHMGEGGDVSAEGKALLQASALLSDTLAKEGLELHRRHRRRVRPHHPRSRRARPDRRRGARHGVGGVAGRLPVEGPGHPSGHGAGSGLMPPQREWLDKDYYEILGVPKTATDKEITRSVPQARQAVSP